MKNPKWSNPKGKITNPKKRKWTPYGEYYGKDALAEGKNKLKKLGFTYKTTRGSFIGSYTLLKGRKRKK